MRILLITILSAIMAVESACTTQANNPEISLEGKIPFDGMMVIGR